MNAIALPRRTDLDLEVDRLFRCMTQAEDPALQADYCRRFTAAVNLRNASRSAAEIAEIERARGLRA
jgi:hypothetical protein